MNNKTFSGKVALVTGATSGIGKATAIEFARAGAKVVLIGRREKEGAQVVAEIEKLGGEAAFVRADVAKDADVKRMVDFTVGKFGRLDIAFNNAGVEWIGTLDGLVNADIKAEVSGYLIEQAYKEGSFVKKGQLLFQIDPRPFQAALDQARAQLAQSQGQLAQAHAQTIAGQVSDKRHRVDEPQQLDLRLGQKIFAFQP